MNIRILYYHEKGDKQSLRPQRNDQNPFELLTPIKMVKEQAQNYKLELII